MSFCADGDDSDRTARMCRLVLAFVGVHVRRYVFSRCGLSLLEALDLWNNKMFVAPPMTTGLIPLIDYIGNRRFKTGRTNFRKVTFPNVFRG